jgi:hypothetical protein
MNDMNDSPLIFVVALIVFVLGYLLGFTLTEKRIYNNCLEANATMIHKDAVAKCKEFIK